MRKNDGDMEIALEVPQPRLRAVPSDPAPPDDSPSDAELLARVGDRDREAFELLYGRYIRSVFGLALRRLGDRGHAEDAAQEAFTAIWRSASTYRPERGAAGGWLYTVARNA
jgi:RNA polymerase sigma-70 factor (ECF subfamily)